MKIGKENKAYAIVYDKVYQTLTLLTEVSENGYHPDSTCYWHMFQELFPHLLMNHHWWLSLNLTFCGEEITVSFYLSPFYVNVKLNEMNELILLIP